MDDLVSVPVVDPNVFLTSLTPDKAVDWVAHGTQKVCQPFGEVGPTDVRPTPNRTIKSPEESPAVIPQRCPVDDLTPVPTRPAQKKAKQALDTPLSAHPEFKRPSTVAKGKQVTRQVAKDLAKKWLDF